MTVQTLVTASGEQLVVLSRRDYDALLARSGDEEAEDRMTLIIAAEARAESTLPPDVSSAVLAGDSLIKALRRWRGKTQAELASAAGINQGFLSEMEARTKQGSHDTLAKLAACLDVPEAWLG